MPAPVARVVVVNDNGSSAVCQRAGLALGNALCVLALSGAKSLPSFEAVIRVGKDQVTIFQTLQGIHEPIIPPFFLIRARASLKIQPATPEHCCVWQQVRLFDLGYAAFARTDYVFQGFEGLLIETTPFRMLTEIIYMPSVVVPLVGKQIP